MRFKLPSLGCVRMKLRRRVEFIAFALIVRQLENLPTKLEFSVASGTAKVAQSSATIDIMGGQFLKHFQDSVPETAMRYARRLPLTFRFASTWDQRS